MKGILDPLQRFSMPSTSGEVTDSRNTTKQTLTGLTSILPTIAFGSIRSARGCDSKSNLTTQRLNRHNKRIYTNPVNLRS